jgi:hypothetical protein
MYSQYVIGQQYQAEHSLSSASSLVALEALVIKNEF